MWKHFTSDKVKYQMFGILGTSFFIFFISAHIYEM